MTACRLADTCIVPHGVSRDVGAPPPPPPPPKRGGRGVRGDRRANMESSSISGPDYAECIGPRGRRSAGDRVSSPDPGVVRRDAVFIIF